MKKKLNKIVLTGAPSSGKSSTLEAISKLQIPNLVLVPESAVVLLKGGFSAPDHNDLEQIRAFQKAIIPVQENLEVIFERKNPNAQNMILDRAKLDGAAFWPPGPEDYFKSYNVDKNKELAAYDYVIFMEMPQQEYFGGTHESRFHNYEQSMKSGQVLEQVWSAHPRFIKIAAEAQLDNKVKNAIESIIKILA